MMLRFRGRNKPIKLELFQNWLFDADVHDVQGRTKYRLRINGKWQRSEGQRIVLMSMTQFWNAIRESTRDAMDKVPPTKFAVPKRGRPGTSLVPKAEDPTS